MRRKTRKLGTLAVAALLSLAAASTARAADTRAPFDGAAYFNLRDTTGSDFVVKLTDPARIREAREIVDKGERKYLIGRIVKQRADYNRRWDFHYNPDTVSFADQVIEVCDATIPYVEDHLDEAGGPFLPGLYWCPWSGRLTRELPAAP
ncbi:BP74-related protein [Streptomyces sp. NBC_01497]|uniref:BP74-related protein n=1 Tax=Streptomyces sp. NBC_01497 TaxID=2903885 RepID=UPI002E32B730|nr:calmodulin-binding protein [Streptomyces sp. NBC_01497]